MQLPILSELIKNKLSILQHCTFFRNVFPKDEMMDDMNWDGKIDHKDGAVIYKIIDKLHGKSFYQGFVGGLASYRKTVDHGPFVHVDVRGRRARWGD
jgi:hypothetical protein